MNIKYWLVFWILIIEILVILLLIPSSWVKNSVQEEHQMIHDQIGEKMQLHVQENAIESYQSIMVDTGFMGMIRHALTATPDQEDKSIHLGPVQDIGVPYMAQRAEVLSQLSFLFFSRLSMLKVWLPYILLLFLPAIYDGINTRRIKKTNFQYTSPIIHRVALQTSGFIVIALLTAFIVPIAIWPLMPPVALMTISVLMGLAFGNMQKRF